MDKQQKLLADAADSLQKWLDDYGMIMSSSSVALVKAQIKAVRATSRRPVFTATEVADMYQGLGFWYSDYNDCPPRVIKLIHRLKLIVEPARPKRRRKVLRSK